MFDVSIAALIIAIIFLIIGFIGTMLPFVPGIPLMFVTMAVYGWYEGFVNMSPEYLVIMGIMALAAVLADHLSPLIGVTFFGSSRYALIGAALGFIIGLIFFPPFGMVVGALAGAIIGEYFALEDWELAFKAGIGSVAGFVSGILFQIAIALAMLVSFIVRIV